MDTDIIQAGSMPVTYEPATITADFAGMEKVLRERLADYDGLTQDSIANCDIKELKPLRAELNRMSKELNDARKAIKREFSKPLNDFEEQCKRLDALILAPCDIIDAEIKRQEMLERDARYAALEDAYYDFCDANGVSTLVANVQFDRIVESQWLTKSFGEVKAKNALMDKVASILADWQAVQATTYNYPDEAEACFFRTLSLREVADNDNALRQQREAVKMLQEETGKTRGNDAEEPVHQEQDGLASYEVRVNMLDDSQLYVALAIAKIAENGSATLKLSDDEKSMLVACMKAMNIHGTIKEVRNE